MKTKKLTRLALLICAVIFMLNCGGNGKSSSNNKSEEKIANLSNEQLATDIVKIYEEGITGLGEILEKYPQANNAMKEEYEKLFEATIQKLLPYGMKIKEKGSADAEKIGGLIFDEILASSKIQPVLEAYNARSSEIKAFDSALASKMAAMNTVTQYAFFDLLKEQNPEEAKRLGVE